MYRVLLVDDEPVDLEGLERLVPWHAFDMQVAASADSSLDALAYIREHEIDLLVTDIKMPMLSGLELARQALERLPRLKVVFISGYQDFHYAKQALQLDAAAYIVKPFDDEEIEDVLRRTRAALDAEREQAKMRETYALSAALLRNEAVAAWLSGQADWPSVLERLGADERGAVEAPEAFMAARGMDARTTVPAKTSRNRKLAEELEAFVADRLGGAVTIKDAAARFAFTPNYLGRLFKEETGENFSDFVARKRMEEAARLLRETRMKVYEVAERVGIRNVAYFGKQFRERFGMTPNEYRRQH